MQDDQVRVPQEPQSVEEDQGEATIEDFEQVTKQSEHPVDLVDMPLPDNPFGSSETRSIVFEDSQVHQVVDVPHIDFIFRDQQWQLADCLQIC